MRPTAGPRSRTRAVVGALVAVSVAVVAACTPATSPPPTVAPQPVGRGVDTSVDSAPSGGCVTTAAEAVALPKGTSLLLVPLQGGTRGAVLSVPSGLSAPAPVLVSLHPFTLGPDAWEEYSGLAAAAVARGYVVLTPLGSDPGPRWAVPGGLDTGVDDIGFVSAALDRVEDGLCVDRNREFAAGFSAGAAMAQALSCTMPWRFAAVAGSGGTNLTELCGDSPPTDVFVLHGSADAIAPLTGSEIVFAPPLGLPVSSVVATDAARAGCDPTPTTTQPFADVTARTYVDCDDGARVQYWEMLGAGHSWAGAGPSLLDLVVGSTSQTFSATDEVLDFFDAT